MTKLDEIEARLANHAKRGRVIAPLAAQYEDDYKLVVRAVRQLGAALMKTEKGALGYFDDELDPDVLELLEEA